MSIRWSVLPSPVDDLLLVCAPAADGDALTGVYFTEHKPSSELWDTIRSGAPQDDGHPVLVAARSQLVEYFDGGRTVFDLPLAPTGSEFQLRVWAQLRRIGYGRTVSYGEVAAGLGLVPGASRAVGLANGANPISIIVPCHRVIGANGSLTGYGGGLERKRYLLDLEQGSTLF